MKRVFPLLTACSFVFALACGDSSGGPGSGGAAGTLDGPDVMLTAATEAVYTAGALDGEDWETFGRVGPVSFDGAGNLHILDTQADRIVVVAPDGSFVRTVGKPGEGPGEFQSPIDLIVDRDGGYVVTSFNGMAIFGPEGEYKRSIGLDPFQGVPMWVQGVSAGRVLASSVMRMNRPEEREESGIVPETEGRPIEGFPLDGGDPEVLYTAWELPEISDDESDVSTQTSSTGRRMMSMTMAPPRAFVPGLHFDVLSDGRLAVVDSIGYRVKLVGVDGTVAGVIERPIPPTPVTDAIRDAERERRRAAREGQESITSSGTATTFNVTMGSLDDMTFADEIPVIDDMVVDWEDRIWVARTGEDGEDEGPIDIVTPEGSYVGTLSVDGLRIPAAFGPDGLMAYIESDEYDVQTVRVIRLVSLDR